MKLRLLCLAFITAASLSAAGTLPAFNAIMTMGKDHRFVLVSDEGKTSGWLKIGSAFDGTTIKHYDEASGGLDLERDGKVTRVRLVADASVKDGGAGVPLATPATLADADAVLKAMHFDEMFSKIMDQQKKSMGPMMQRMTAGMKVSDEDKARITEMQKKVMDGVFDSLSGPEMKSAVAGIYSSIFSKEELASLGAFYSTPAGQSMVAKQPAVQEKMMEVMMPKMAEIGPKMQQVMKEFAAEQQAKRGAAPATPAPAPTPAPGKP
jgi:hypothetical protein